MFYYILIYLDLLGMVLFLLSKISHQPRLVVRKHQGLASPSSLSDWVVEAIRLPLAQL